MKRVAIIGISGFPSRKGGFDSFVSELVENSRGQIFFELYTETSNQSDKAESGVNFIKIPVFRPIGFFGLIQHRIEAFRRAEYGKCENIYILGYTALPFVFRKNKRKNLMVNMDGLEWKRSEYSLIKRTFLRLAEYIAVTKADILVADSLSIQAYIFEKFKRRSVFVPYSAPLPCEFSRDQVQSVLSKFKLTIADYYLFVGRCVRENHLLEIVKAFCASGSTKKLFIATDKRKNTLRTELEQMQSHDPRIVHLDPVYDKIELETLRGSCFAYLHGHSVGGTNPSLLESLVKAPPIVAHRNKFNQEVLGESARYFSSEVELKGVFDSETMIKFPNSFDSRLSIAEERYSIKALVEKIWEVLI